MRVELPGGRIVQAHGLSGFIPTDEDEAPDWALYLDEQWRVRAIEWPQRFVDWPDFELPVDEPGTFDAIAEAWRRVTDGQLVDLACDGGTGRTGTALACLAVLAGISPPEAAGWVRSHYHLGGRVPGAPGTAHRPLRRMGGRSRSGGGRVSRMEEAR